MDLDVVIGAPVASAGTGIVHFAGNVAGTPTVSINHAGGLRTTYQPVFPRVKAGDHVTVGEIIGTLASPPTEPRACTGVLAPALRHTSTR